MKHLIAIFTLMLFSSAYADSYKAPSFKMPTAKPVDSKAQKSAWDDEAHFKVEEGSVERDLASSPDRESEWAKPDEPAPAPPAKDEGKIIPWKMMDKQ